MDEKNDNVFYLDEYRKTKDQRNIIENYPTTRREKEQLGIIKKLSGFIDDLFKKIFYDTEKHDNHQDSDSDI